MMIPNLDPDNTELLRRLNYYFEEDNKSMDDLDREKLIWYLGTVLLWYELSAAGLVPLSENEKREYGKGREHLISCRVTKEVYEVLKSMNKSPSLAARAIVEQEYEKSKKVQNT